MSSKHNILSQCRLFQAIPPEGIAEAALLARLREFEEGQIIYQKGISAKTLTLVESGSIRVNAVNSSGKEMTLMFCSAGNWFGDGIFFPDSPRPYGAVAHEQTRILEFAAADFIALLARYPQCYPSIIQQLGRRLEAALLIIEDDVLRSIPARLARRLLFAADFHIDGGADSASLRLTQEQVGNMLGISRQAIYRAMQKLKTEGLIDFSYGSISIISKAALEVFISRD